MVNQVMSSINGIHLSLCLNNAKTSRINKSYQEQTYIFRNYFSVWILEHLERSLGVKIIIFTQQECNQDDRLQQDRVYYHVPCIQVFKQFIVCPNHIMSLYSQNNPVHHVLGAGNAVIMSYIMSSPTYQCVIKYSSLTMFHV